ETEPGTSAHSKPTRYTPSPRFARKRPTAFVGSVGCISSMWPMPVGRIAFLNPNPSCVSRRYTDSPNSFVNCAAAASRSRTTTDRSTRSPSMPWGILLRDARQPGMIAAAREPLREIAAGARGIAGPEARLEQRVVEDVALRPAAAQLDDARAQRIDLFDRRRVLALRERVQALDERHENLAHETRGILRRPR